MARDQRGTAIVEFVWLAVLLLVPVVYLVLTVFEAQRASYAASTAARSAGRAFLTAPDQATGRARAQQAARIAFADQGLDRVPAVTIRCRPRPTDCLTAGSVVTAAVRGSARLPLAPAILGDLAPTVRLDAEHTAPYGTFRQARP